MRKSLQKISCKECVLLVAVAIVTFAGTLQYGFVADDLPLFIDNPVYASFDLKGMLLGLGNGLEYLPVRDISIAIDHSLFWGNPFGYHFTNLCLYILTVLLIFRVAERLARLLRPVLPETTGLKYFPLFSALLFTVHPLHSEVVSWITARNQLLSGIFTFLCLYAWIRVLETDRTVARGWYLLAVVAFVLSLLSKASGILLPAAMVMLFLIVRPGRPFFALRLTALFWTVSTGAFFLFRAHAEKTFIMGHEPAEVQIIEKLATSFQIVFFYLQELLFPFGLTTDYAPQFQPELYSPAAMAGGAALLALIAGAWVFYRRWPLPAFGMIWFVCMLMPALHFFPTYPLVAHRYVYLSSFGFCLCVAWLICRIPSRTVAVTALFIIITSWMYLAMQQNKGWTDEVHYWQAAVDSNLRHTKALGNLGTALLESGEQKRGLYFLKRAEELNPFDPRHEYFLGAALAERGLHAEALAHVNDSLARDPEFIMALYLLGQLEEELGNRDAAIAAFRRVVETPRLDPRGFFRDKARASLQRLTP